MSTIGSYKTRTFSENQKFLVLDPATGTTSLVAGSSLVDYLRPSLNSVQAETTTQAALNEDYDVGEVVQTTGDASPGDGDPGLFLVVASGTGGIPMLNGNELLVLAGANTALGISYDGTASGYSATNVQEAIDNFSFNTATNGSDLVAHTGTSDTVTQALDKRTIFVGSVAEVEALSSPAGYNIYLTQEGRAGEFIVKTGTPPSDPQKGVYIVLANGNYAERTEQFNLNVGHFGATYTGDESTVAQAMVDLLNELRVPAGKTLTAKNIELNNNTAVDVKGTLKMPDSCVDFDKAIYGYSLSGVKIDVSEFDGNAANQSGTLGTHLIYLIDLSDSDVNVRYAKNHYYVKGGSVGNTDGGNRDASAGAIFFRRADKVTLDVKYMDKWGREGIQFRESTDCTVTVGHLQSSGDAEYSGLQVEGVGNTVSRVSVDNALASGVGFDTANGTLSNVISTNTRENHGLNIGHPGWPASNSTISNVVVDKAILRGIQIASATKNLKLSNISVSNSGEYGLVASDSSDNITVTGGELSLSGIHNVLAGGSLIKASNVGLDRVDDAALIVGSATGRFQDGESVSDGTASGTVRTAVGNTDDSIQTVFINSVTGTFTGGNTLTGATSGETATITSVRTPAEVSEISGGKYVPDERLFPGFGFGDQIRFKDGTAIFEKIQAVEVTSGGVDKVEVVSFGANALWASAPNGIAVVRAPGTTGGYDLDRLELKSTTSDFTVTINASVAQVYSISVLFIGRWK